jgi:hypothetical protein
MSAATIAPSTRPATRTPSDTLTIAHGTSCTSSPTGADRRDDDPAPDVPGLFVFVFGDASPGQPAVPQFALPESSFRASRSQFTTALGLNVDFQRGLIDRFRSLPIARSSVIAGRIVADTVPDHLGEIIWSSSACCSVSVTVAASPARSERSSS